MEWPIICKRQFHRHFHNENNRFSIQMSLKFVIGQMDNILAMFEAMAWCRAGAKPFSEAMMTRIYDMI